MELTILNRQRSHPVSVRGLESFVRRVVRQFPDRVADSLAICLVSDGRMSELNERYRGRKSPTDVLSFPNDEGADPAGRLHLGDIVISVQTARRQARDRGHSLVRELRVLVLHGYLHLLGYDHEKDDGAMMRLQRKLERRLFVERSRESTD